MFLVLKYSHKGIFSQTVYCHGEYYYGIIYWYRLWYAISDGIQLDGYTDVTLDCVLHITVKKLQLLQTTTQIQKSYNTQYNAIDIHSYCITQTYKQFPSEYCEMNQSWAEFPAFQHNNVATTAILHNALLLSQCIAITAVSVIYTYCISKSST